MNFNINVFAKIVSESLSYSAVARKLNLHANGTSFRYIKGIVKQYNIDCSHFLNAAQIKNVNKYGRIDKYVKIQKVCPICKKVFETQQGHPREKIVCSHSCSNTYFRSGKSNPNYKGEKGRNYREHYLRINKSIKHLSDLKCLRCGYSEFPCGIDIHHIDGNRKNNSSKNLIALCSPCHRALHRGLWLLNEIDSLQVTTNAT